MTEPLRGERGAMPEYHILNLGAGVQSTALYLLSMDGQVPKFDAAIFADTKAEPGAVYKHLKWLQSLNGPRIYVRSKGSLAKHLRDGVNSTGQRHSASIPAFTAPKGSRHPESWPGAPPMHQGIQDRSH
jgi:hypothetical protein